LLKKPSEKEPGAMAKIITAIEFIYLRLTDAIFARWPGPRPSAQQFEKCRLIAHRGDYDNLSIKENTLDAFDRAAAAGVWGLEMDLRWTRDLVPVIIHDPDLGRIYQDHRRIDHLQFSDLHRQVPAIPTLAEVVSRYGGRHHLMIEVKEDRWPDIDRQNRILSQILKPLKPAADYHLMALSPAVLAKVSAIPETAFIPIAYYRPKKMFRQILAGRWGGMCGHYTLMSNRLVQRLKSRGKQVGTGYADSSGCLFREIRRGIDWIFSNNAVQMQRVVQSAVRGH